MSRRRRTTENDDIEEIRKGFEMFDVNGTGVINPFELLEAMDSMNIKEKNPFIYEMIESLCSEKEFRKKGGVTLDELVGYVYNKVNDTETNVGLRQIYDVINDRDTDNVSMSTFYTLARDYGDQLSEDQIRELLEKTQMGGSELNFDEFYTIMKGAIKDHNRNNSSYMNMSRSSYRSNNKNNEVYVRKKNNNSNLSNSNSTNKKSYIVDNNKKVRSKKFIYDEPRQSEPEYEPEQEKEPEKIANEPENEPQFEQEKPKEEELDQPLEDHPIFQEENQNPQEEDNQHIVEEIVTTTKIVNQNDNYINNNNNNNYNDNEINNINEENNNNYYPQNENEMNYQDYQDQVNKEQTDNNYNNNYYQNPINNIQDENENNYEDQVNKEQIDNNYNNNYYQNPINNIQDENENNYDDQVNKEQIDNNSTPISYSYRKVHIGNTPKYEKLEENNNYVDNNLNSNNINNNNDYDDGKYKKERQTKISRLPDGGKQIEITEKTEIVKERPYIRGHRFRFSKKNDEKEKENNNNEDEKKQEKNTYYRIRRPRGKDLNDKNEVEVKKVEVEENSEVIIPKRYHRRYRETKTSTNKEN